MKVLKQKSALEKSITNAEEYLELRQIPTMELFGFRQNVHHRYTSVMEEDIRK